MKMNKLIFYFALKITLIDNELSLRAHLGENRCDRSSTFNTVSSSGETFKQYSICISKITVAHKNKPFNTFINLLGERDYILAVND